MGDCKHSIFLNVCVVYTLCSFLFFKNLMFSEKSASYGEVEIARERISRGVKIVQSFGCRSRPDPNPNRNHPPMLNGIIDLLLSLTPYYSPSTRKKGYCCIYGEMVKENIVVLWRNNMLGWRCFVLWVSFSRSFLRCCNPQRNMPGFDLGMSS